MCDIFVKFVGCYINSVYFCIRLQNLDKCYDETSIKKYRLHRRPPFAQKAVEWQEPVRFGWPQA